MIINSRENNHQVSVAIEDYISFAKNLTDKEKALIADYKQWLPAVIIDCHAHCNLRKHVLDIDNRAYNHMLSTFPAFSLTDSARWNDFFHPGKKVLSLRFANVFRGVNHKKANEYLLEHSPQDDRVALYGLPNNADYTIKTMDHYRVSALKMYYSYLEPPAEEIYQFFPPRILAATQEKGVPIVLHLPTELSSCVSQVLRLVDDFPKLKICLAYIGLAESLSSDLERALTTLKQYRQIAFDTALVTSADVLEAAINLMEAERTKNNVWIRCTTSFDKINDL